ncbi:GntR family transcriptional regulator [Histidinibacterium aquaticum]|uniref:GntR family transcriptional regulator n=1 Tax=Histidinibacterium aquaticum TaxID=2613962 RepID=A0A5J5GKM7_9RHOB|nr:GntR family transcriptional regulator [Histidinibacterium aquaticum]KAA9008755.1 GntR family transcriptional regulator [Histidinibacterium aquaticum]
MSRSLTQDTYEALRSAILVGKFAPDTLWSDRELAAQLGFSRTPVREAIQRLAADGLVEVIPRRGTRVLPLLADDVREIHQVARALELEAAIMLATSRKRDLGPLQRLVAEMAEALEAADRDRWVRADEAFHHDLVEACGNRRLARMYHAQRGLTDRARYFALHLRDLPTKSADDHRAMLEAIERRDTARLCELYHEHWDRTTAELLALIERHGSTMPVQSTLREEKK